MADNTTLDPGAGGDTIATDDVAGVKYQYVKLADGTADSAEKIGGDAANGLDVDVTRLPGSITGKAEDAVAVSGDVGVPMLAVRNDTAAVKTNANGDYSMLATDSAGRLGIATLGGSIDVSGSTVVVTETQVVADNAAYTDGLTVTYPAGFVFDEVAGTALTENDAAAARIDAKRAQVGVIEDATTRGQRAAVSAGGALKVDGSAATQPVSATNLSTNVAQVAGTATDVNSGTKSAGTQRVVIATDQPQLTNALKVDGSGFTQPVSGTVTANLGTAAVTNAGTFAVQDSEKIADDAAFGVASTKLMPIGFLADQTATDSVNEGDIGAARITLDRKQIVTNAPSADTEGWDVFMASSGDGSTALTSTAQAVKASAGKLGGWYIYNPNATATYVILYNVASGSVTVGTTNPRMVVCIPATSGANVEWVNGITFDTAIAIAATTTGGGNTAPSTALEANILYK